MATSIVDATRAAPLASKRILVGVTGGIAAYKSCELVRRLQDRGADVRVAMTAAATEFITPLTLAALSGNPVHQDLLNAETESAMGHIEVARWADLIVIAPASADFIARLANGHGDDLLTTICLAANCPIAVAPAMNQAMWGNASTQANMASLRARDFLIMGPAAGMQACGETGEGRLLDINDLADAVVAVFPNTRLNGRHVVITAGPTREAIDPVRYISNHSSGKQGYALAEAAIEAGARVTLISGPTGLPVPERAKVINVVSATEMYDAAMALTGQCDIFIGVAAVGDYRPVQRSPVKLKKSDAPSNRTITIELTENPDIIASVAASQPRPFTVGFAAETNDVVAYARGKLDKKRLDMIIANDVSDSDIGFGSDQNETTVLWDGFEETLPRASKRTISSRIVEMISNRLTTPASDTLAQPVA